MTPEIEERLNRIAGHTFKVCYDNMYTIEDFIQIVHMKYYEYREDDLTLIYQKIYCDMIDITRYRKDFFYNQYMLDENFSGATPCRAETERLLEEIDRVVDDEHRGLFERMFVRGETGRFIAESEGHHETNITYKKNKLIESIRSKIDE